MKKRLIFLLVILTSFFCAAQDKEICLPDSIVAKIIDDLVIKDHLVYKVNLQDSIIQVYQHKDSLSTVEIQKYKLKEKEYKIVVEALEQQLKIVESENKDLRIERTKLKITYALLKAAAKYREFKPCVKRYLTNHMRSKFLKIGAKEWQVAIFLPIERFEKATKTEVWRRSLESIK